MRGPLRRRNKESPAATAAAVASGEAEAEGNEMQSMLPPRGNGGTETGDAGGGSLHVTC